MVILLCTLVFSAAFLLSLAVIASMLVGEWDKIMRALRYQPVAAPEPLYRVTIASRSGRRSPVLRPATAPVAISRAAA